MWYLLFALIVSLFIIAEKSTADKKYYLIFSLIFPTIAYSLWRVKSNSKSKLQDVNRMCIWFSISHTALTAFWIISEYSIYSAKITDISYILILWLGVMFISACISVAYRIEKTILN